jgi:hypothetical protein
MTEMPSVWTLDAAAAALRLALLSSRDILLLSPDAQS